MNFYTCPVAIFEGNLCCSWVIIASSRPLDQSMFRSYLLHTCSRPRMYLRDDVQLLSDGQNYDPLDRASIAASRGKNDQKFNI